MLKDPLLPIFYDENAPFTGITTEDGSSYQKSPSPLKATKTDTLTKFPMSTMTERHHKQHALQMARFTNCNSGMTVYAENQRLKSQEGLKYGTSVANKAKFLTPTPDQAPQTYMHKITNFTAQGNQKQTETVSPSQQEEDQDSSNGENQDSIVKL